MSRLLVGFDVAPSSSSGAVVPIEVIDQSFNTERKTAELGPPADVGLDLAPGDYLVRAVLPSGETASAQVTVYADVPAYALLRLPKRSPRENLTWAYHLQTSPAAAGSRSAGVSPTTRSGPSRELPKFQLWRVRAGAAVEYAQRWSPIPVAESGAANVYSSLSIDTTLRASDSTAVAAMSIRTNEDLRNFEPLWVQVRFRDRTVITAIPPAWEMHVLVIDDPRPGDARAFRVMVGGGDPTAQSLLGFLASGAFDAARRVGGAWATLAEILLQNKIEDPVSAAAAGYYLLKAGELEKLHDWTRNLANWFPWLADGPIIHAWHLAAQDDSDQAEIRRNLLDGAARGVPIYPYGLRMLVDGLTVFDRESRGDDADVAAALRYARAYASAAAWNSTTTAFVGKHPAFPGRPSDTTAERHPFDAVEIVSETRQRVAGKLREKAGPAVSIDDRTVKGWRVVELSGVFERKSVETVRKALEIVERKGSRVIVDVSKLRFIDAHGMSVLALARERSRGDLRLVVRPGPVELALRRTFQLQQFSVYSTVAAAIRGDIDPRPSVTT